MTKDDDFQFVEVLCNDGTKNETSVIIKARKFPTVAKATEWLMQWKEQLGTVSKVFEISREEAKRKYKLDERSDYWAIFC